MLYKPEYCCNCGQKVERAEWKPWTSRCFCETCESEHRLKEWAPKLLSLCCVLIGIFGFGSLLSKDEKPLNLSSRQFAETSVAKKNAKDVIPQVPNDLSLQNTGNGNVRTIKENRGHSPINTAQEKPPPQLKNTNQAVVEEMTYYCGAPTKKGTPCSRRVKGSTRCWQHKGQAALLPQEKLIAGK